MSLPTPLASPPKPKRRNSVEFPVLPASKQPPLTTALQRWIHAVDMLDDTYHRTLRWYAKMDIHMSEQVFTRIYNGETQSPKREACEKLAAYFAQQVARGLLPPVSTPRMDDEETVLELAGWDTYRSLRVAVSDVRYRWEEQGRLRALLEWTRSPEWRTSKLVQKRRADTALRGNESIGAKVTLIASYIEQWIVDAKITSK